MSVKYCWETDQFNDPWRHGLHESIEECIQEAKKNDVSPGEKIFIGEAIPYIPQISADSVCELLMEDSTEYAPEDSDWPHFERGKGWLGEDLLQEKLDKLLKEWLDETNQHPNFYQIDSVREVMVE